MNSDVGRTLNGAATANAEMTNEMCTSFCFGKGFPYAGTEYYTECFCGDTLATGGTEVDASDCAAACGGNSAQPCGGGNRLTIYKTDQVSGPSVNPGVGDWVSMGCYTYVTFSCSPAVCVRV